MSQSEVEEEAASLGDSSATSPADPIDNATLEVSQLSPGIIVEQNFFADKPAGNEANESADSQLIEGDAVKNGNWEAVNSVEENSSGGIVKEDLDSRIGDRSDGKDAAMAEALINGLHIVELGGVARSVEDVEQQTIVNPGQDIVVSQIERSDRGDDTIVSPQKGRQPGGAVEHHRKPPISGSQTIRTFEG
jgi:hypothetical protein